MQNILRNSFFYVACDKLVIAVEQDVSSAYSLLSINFSMIVCVVSTVRP